MKEFVNDFKFGFWFTFFINLLINSKSLYDVVKLNEYSLKSIVFVLLAVFILTVVVNLFATIVWTLINRIWK